MKRLGDGELEIMLAVWGEEEPVSSTLVQEKLRGRRPRGGGGRYDGGDHGGCPPGRHRRHGAGAQWLAAF